MKDVLLGVIGGSGIYGLNNVSVEAELSVKTPFGPPSDRIVIGKTGGRLIAFLPRHGKGHRHSPTEVPSRANIWALKSLGVKKVIAVSAVGSLKEEIRPTDIVLPSQIIDKTKSRPLSYYGEGLVGHIAFAEPFCNRLRAELRTHTEIYLKEKSPGKRLFCDETYVCMEGPQFSTKAESELHRSWGAGVVGMTAIPEAKLAREAELCYASIAMPTDYDCWRENEAAVDGSMVLQYMKENNKTVNDLLPFLLEKITPDCDCGCHHAAQFAIFTDKSRIPAKTKKKLSLLFGKYW